MILTEEQIGEKIEQRADALLRIARDWQNGEYTREWQIVTDDILPRFVSCLTVEKDMLDGASAALSEAAGLGFDLVNADGTPTKKVASFEPCGGVRREDGSEYRLYRRVKR